MNEDQFLRVVIDVARVDHWHSFHARPAQTARGWRTPVQGDGKGFPDLLLLRGDRIMAVELKSNAGKLTNEQSDWLERFSAAGVDARVWRPKMLQDEILRALE